MQRVCISQHRTEISARCCMHPGYDASDAASSSFPGGTNEEGWAYSVALSLKKRISRFLQRTVWKCMEQSCGTGKNELLSVRCVRYSHCNNGATGAPGAIAAGTVDHWAAAWTQHLAPLGVTRSHRFEVFDVHSFSQKTVISMYAHRKKSNSGLHLDRQLAVEYDPGMPQRWILLEALASLKHGPPGWVATPSMALLLRCRLKTYSV